MHKTSVENGHTLIREEHTAIWHAMVQLHFELVPRIRFTSADLKGRWKKQSNYNNKICKQFIPNIGSHPIARWGFRPR